MNEPAKLERYAKFDEAKAQVKEALAEEYPDRGGELSDAFSTLKYNAVRSMVVKEGKRLDGRDLTTVRPIVCETTVLPYTWLGAVYARRNTGARDGNPRYLRGYPAN